MTGALDTLPEHAARERALWTPALAVTLAFVGLRLTTSETRTMWLPGLGLLLIASIIWWNRTWGFAFTLYDMCLLGEQVGVDAWQLGNVARFRDLEFVLLVGLGVLMGAFAHKGEHFKKLTRPVRYYLLLLGVALLYSGVVHGFLDALRVSRTLFFLALVLVMPAFCRHRHDLLRLMKYVLFFVGVSTLLDWAGFVVGNPAAITPFNRNTDEAGRIWVGLGGVDRIYGGIGYAGYATPFNLLTVFSLVALMRLARRARPVWLMLVVLAVMLEVLSVSRSAIAGLVIGLGTILFIGRPAETEHRRLLTAALYCWGVVILGTSVPLAKYVNPTGRYAQRFRDFIDDVRGTGRGSFASRVQYFPVALEVMRHADGNALSGMGYRLLPTEFGAIFEIGQFRGATFQESGQLIGTTSMDSGWANVFWSLGFAGIAVFVGFIAYYLRVSRQIYRRSSELIPKALSLALFAFFVVYPMLFFAMPLLYGKDIQYMLQFGLLIGTLGLWLDYYSPAAVEGTRHA